MAINSKSLRADYKGYNNSWDLNMFANVLQYKQQKYDSGAAAIQSKVDNFASLDVLADTDREYLNSKINETVKGISSLGGADLSDSSVLSQLSGYVGDIGKDPRIIDAVLDTKKVRALQAGRSQINKDFNAGKKGVYRSDANEAEENKHVSAYLKAKETDPTARYEGYSSPIAYHDYSKYLDEQVKAIKASSQEFFSPSENKYMYLLKSGKQVTADEIYKTAQNSLTPEYQGQMNRDAQYLYRNTPDESILDQYNATANRRISQLNNQIKSLDAVKSVESTAAKLVLGKEKEKLQQDVLDRRNELQKILTSNREGAVNMLYQNRFFEGLADKYAYSEQKLKPVWNQGQMHVDKLRQSDQQFSSTMKFRMNELNYRKYNDSENRKLGYLNAQIAAIKAGGDVTSDGRIIEGSGKMAKGNDSHEFISQSFPTDTDPKVEELLRLNNDQLKNTKDNVKSTFYNDIKQHIDEDGKLGMFKVDEKTKQWVPTDKWIKANKELYQAANDIAAGRPTRLSSLPEEFVEYQKKIHGIELLQKSNQDNIDKIRTTALDRTRATLLGQKGFTDADWKLYQRGKNIVETKGVSIKTSADYVVGRGGEVYDKPASTRIDVNQSKLSEADRKAYEFYNSRKSRVEPVYQQQKTAFEKELSSRLNNIGTTLSKNQLADPSLVNAIRSQANGYYTLNDKGGIEQRPDAPKQGLATTDFKPLGFINQNLDGTIRPYATGTITVDVDGGKVTKQVYVPLDAKTAGSINNFSLNPSQYIVQSIMSNENKTVEDRAYSNSRNGRVDIVVDFKVIELSDGRYLLKTKVGTDSQGNPLKEPEWATIPMKFNSATEAHNNGSNLAELYQQYKEKTNGKPYSDFILNLSK